MRCALLLYARSTTALIRAAMQWVAVTTAQSPCQIDMKPKCYSTVLWTLAFPAATFLAWGAVGFIIAHTHRHLILLTYWDAVFKVIFFVSPAMALLLGLRGTLPGTKPKARRVS